MLEKNVLFAVDDIQRIEFSDYPDDEFAIAKVGFLSTRPNAHGLIITEDVLRSCAPSALGKWMVAKMERGDATTHLPDEVIMGIIPQNQEIEFVEDDDGYLRAYADAVISKIYSKEYCAIFENDNNRAVSVEMRIITDEDGEDKVLSFNIVGVTTLGKTVLPSCPESNVEFIRFAENEADDYFNKIHLTSLKKFAKERRSMMEEKKTYKVDKSKEAMSDTEWGKIDKAELREAVMNAENRNSLVHDVYMKVEDGWEDAPSEKLGYPVMELKDDTFIYNRYALSSALAYAKGEDDEEVVKKVEKIYKKLDLDDSDGKEEKMSEDIKMETPEVEMAEEEKDAEMAQDENIECAEPEKDDEQESADNEPENDDSDVEMSVDEMKEKIARLEADIEERDHIIMDKDAELEELRAYKATVVAKEMACRVDALMEEVSCYMDADQAATFREEGLACNESNIDAWSNKVKATCFSAVKREIKKDSKGVFTFGMPKMIKKSDPNSIWEKLENK